MFIPLIFACAAATNACENVPEKIRASQFETAARCMEFAKSQAPKVVAMFGGADVYVTVACAAAPVETCRLDRRPGARAFGEVARAISWRIVPFARGGADCTGAVDERGA